MQNQLTAIFPGTFDPITNGHINLIERAFPLFKRFIVAVANNPSKKTLFSLEQRVEFCKQAFSHLNGIEILGYSNLMAHFAAEQNSTILVRGVRNSIDFEYEKQLYQMNQKLKADLDTFYLIPDASVAFISSTLVKEIAMHGGDIRELVPTVVKNAMTDRLK